jgi:hypothetical protein
LIDFGQVLDQMANVGADTEIVQLSRVNGDTHRLLF